MYLQNAIHFAMLYYFYFCITICIWEVINMSFKIEPYKKETENKTIRFPVSLIEDIETAIENQNTTFSSFVIQACRYALDNLEID